MKYIGSYEDYAVYLADSFEEAKRKDANIYLAPGNQRDYYDMYLMGEGVGKCDKKTYRVIDFGISRKVDMAVKFYRDKEAEAQRKEEEEKEVLVPEVKEEEKTCNSLDFWNEIEKEIREMLERKIEV